MLRDERAPPPSAGDRDDDWLDAVQTLAHLHLVQQPVPAPAQDGGAYERVLADARPVSTATASAAFAAHAADGGAPGTMDPVLIACLENPRERLTLLKFEDQIVRFLKNPREAQLVFPPLSSYHRLIIHRLGDRCGLEHQTADYNQYAPGGYDGNSARAVTLLKTALSAVPTVLLIDLSSDRQQQQTGTPAVVPKIMVRKRAASRPGANGGRGPGDAKNAQRSMQDRERAYAEARARIFGDDSAESSTASPATAAAAPPPSNSPTPASTANGKSNGGSSKMNTNSQQAGGPDGTRGFGGRGRGRGGASAERSPQRHQLQQPQDRSSEPSRNAEAREPESNSSAPRVQSAHNWKESKVLWRNREQELNDPDFTRNHDAYRPSRAASSAAGGGGGANDNNRYPHQSGGRFPPASQMEYYDSSQQQRQQFGYLQQQQPPLPGRRFPAGEFNRLDNMRPPPPPDQFRSGGSRFPMGNVPPPPPPPPGAVGVGLNRGGYASPHARQHQSSPSPVRGGSSGYNADFPPLGK